MPREPKKPTTPPRPRRRTTRRGIAPLEEVELATSTKPTRRDLAAEIETALHPASSARGQYSISRVRAIPAEVVSGSIDTSEPPKRARRRTGAPPDVNLVGSTKRDITVSVAGQILTLDRRDALALAELIASELAAK